MKNDLELLIYDSEQIPISMIAHAQTAVAPARLYKYAQLLDSLFAHSGDL